MSARESMRFPTTQWSALARATGEENADTEISREHLGRLLEKYLGPLRAHLVLRLRMDGERADEMLQGFVARQVIEKGLLARADRQRGRFRTLLLVALDRYVKNERRRERISQRHCQPGGDLPLDEMAAAADASSDAMEVAWARQVLKEAVARMRENCQALGRSDVWMVFEKRLLQPTLSGATPMPYQQLVKELGLQSPGQAANVLITGKRMFARCLRAVVAEYELSESELDAEIAELRQILARGGAE